MNSYICNKCYSTKSRRKKPFRITQCGHIFCDNCLDEGIRPCPRCNNEEIASLQLEEPLLPKVASLFIPLNEAIQPLPEIANFQSAQTKIILSRFYQIDKKYNLLKEEYRKLAQNMQIITEKYRKLRENMEAINMKFAYPSNVISNNSSTFNRREILIDTRKMHIDRKLAGLTIFVTGASRGIGKSIALKAARDGANIVVAAKTAEPHPKLPGTVYSAVAEIEEAGGKALPCIVDIRDEGQVKSAVENAINKFGGIDIVVNNASAISLTDTLATDMKKYDLMNNVNARGTFLVSKLCIPHLKKSANPHIVNISPPLNMKPIWFQNHLAYTMAKYGMSICVLGMAEEFKKDGIAVNAVWPKTAIHTAAIEMLTGPNSSNYSRKAEIVADAVYALICKDSRSVTGQFLIDEDILRKEGITDFKCYACNPENADNLMPDFFLDDYTNSKLDLNTIKDTVKQSSHKSGDFGNGKVAGIFSAINANLNAELVSKTNALYQFNVKGEEASTWYLDLRNGNGSTGKGEPKDPADATLTMNSEQFFAMFSGKLKPTTAFMTGKLKISGNLQKAMKLEKLMISLKAKL
ncbi:Hydroxysteroid dehydrogenase-like protein 2 [Vespula squamosa]|uniref:Hydroxysteroid dehydrogenase-like protein 2 n=1 Tax=Vespula squamosa TaxID=30214 RepID=A0ABD1ZWQ3_VESSQ